MNDQPLGDSLGGSEPDVLLFFLNRLREAVVRASEGLSEKELRAPGVPSGTHLMGLTWHLAAMEVHWFRRVFRGEEIARASDWDVPVDVTRARVVAVYRDACAHSDRIVRASGDLSILSKGTARLPASTSKYADPGESRRVSLRSVVVHMIEETARHAGHADILREQIDGETDL
jgi:uncharacterized damage-inducible protein DinB